MLGACVSVIVSVQRVASGLGADSPFFCSAGICAARAKYYPACSQTEVLEIARTKSQQIFYYALAVETLYPRVTIVPTIRTFFSLKRLVVVDT